MAKLAISLEPIARSIGRGLTRFLILPVYKLVVLMQIRLSRLLLSARGLFFLIFTNRYVLHAVILLISVATIASQWQTKRATAMETGQNSLLYALVTNGKTESVEEEVRPELLVKNTNYLGSETIQALPDIDYDYDELDTPIADLTVPGSIAVQPGGEDASVPGDQPVIRTKTETYVVESGDTIAAIARKFGVNVGTVGWANNLSQTATIRPGDKLKIPPISGVLHTIAKGDTIEKLASKYSVSVEEILAANHLTPTSNLALGEELVLPGATPPAVPVALVRPKTSTKLQPNIPATTIKNKSFDQYQELVDLKGDARPKPADVETAPVAKGKLLWPTKQHVITQYYGWNHTGVDLDGDYVDPIYAAADGVVETAGWNSGGYGLQIMIKHDSGNMKTRYGHASKLFVKVGDTVKRGQVIAMIGTTGRSTGTHLHFEVYANGKRTNPLAYIR